MTFVSQSDGGLCYENTNFYYEISTYNYLCPGFPSEELSLQVPKLIQINKARRMSSHNKIVYDREGN